MLRAVPLVARARRCAGVMATPRSPCTFVARARFICALISGLLVRAGNFIGQKAVLGELRNGRATEPECS